MTTNGRSLKHGQGPGFAVSGISALSPSMSYSLDPGSYIVTLSQVDVTNPSTVTLTDSFGNTYVYTNHGNGVFILGSRAQNPIAVAVTGGFGVDFFSVQSEGRGDTLGTL